LRILIVGFSTSIHVARWIGQFVDCGWDIHLFPSIDTGSVHPQIANVTVYHSVYSTKPPPNTRYRGVNTRLPIPFLTRFFEHNIRRLLYRYDPDYRAHQLQRVIEQIKPDIVHSMEFQAAGYLTLRVKKALGDAFPAWIISNYGSDVYLFGRLKEHRSRVQELLARCDYYTAECERDHILAQNMGLQGVPLAVIPNGGGINLKAIAQYRQPGPVSQRRIILIKGYQHWSGRSLVALNALSYCGDVLAGYEIIVYLASSIDVSIQAELISQKIGIPIRIFPHSPHEEMLRLHGHARVHIGLGISDAASTSMLEAMSTGAFPIQSYSACADEWFVDGEGGLIIDAENPEEAARALRRALTDDDLVNCAAEINAKVIAEKLDYRIVRDKAIQIYQTVMEQGQHKTTLIDLA
jgi:glycosyltransferase involved in cell wall biosynthesis